MTEQEFQKVLFLAYYFPPLAGGGVFRALRFVRYLPQYGWQPVVLTSEGADYHARDVELLRRVPPQVEIHRGRVYDLRPVYEWLYKLRLNPAAHWLRRREGRFMLPDRQVGWWSAASRKGLELIDRERVSAIFSTAPPYTAHLVAYRLKQRTGLPWVADFRDEWADYAFIRQPGPLRRLQVGLERRVLGAADRVVSTTPWITATLREKLPEAYAKFDTIYGGYDPDDLRLAVTEDRSRRFRIVHAGTFYGQRTPEPFLRALAGLLQGAELSASDVAVEFIGSSPPRDLLRTLRLHDVVHNHGQVAHRVALRTLQEATVLLLVQSPEGPRCIPGKTYEYLALGKPLLALVPRPSAVEDLLHNLPGVYLADFTDAREVAAALRRVHRIWQRGHLQPDYHRPEVHRFSYGTLTAQLAKVLVSACAFPEPLCAPGSKPGHASISEEKLCT